MTTMKVSAIRLPREAVETEEMGTSKAGTWRERRQPHGEPDSWASAFVPSWRRAVDATKQNCAMVRNE